MEGFDQLQDCPLAINDHLGVSFVGEVEEAQGDLGFDESQARQIELIGMLLAASADAKSETHSQLLQELLRDGLHTLTRVGRSHVTQPVAGLEADAQEGCEPHQR